MALAVLIFTQKSSSNGVDNPDTVDKNEKDVAGTS